MNKKNDNSPSYDLNEHKLLVNSDLDKTCKENLNKNKDINEIINEIINKLKKVKISEINEWSNLYSEIMEKLNKFKTLLLQNADGLSQMTINEILVKLLEFVTTLNGLKNQLNLLPFNTFNKIYVQNCIQPLMSIQVDLTSVSSAYVGTARGLAFSTVVKRKTYKIRKYEKTTYKMMDLSNCVDNFLQKRIDRFIYMICD